MTSCVREGSAGREQVTGLKVCRLMKTSISDSIVRTNVVEQGNIFRER